MQIDGEAARILQGKAFAHLAVVGEDGRPHVTPVWIDVDDEGRAVFNTAEGRLKARLLSVGTPIALSASDENDPYHFVTVEGRVVERTHDDADAMIDALSMKYRGHDYVRRPGQVRVTIVIEADSVLIPQ